MTDGLEKRLRDFVMRLYRVDSAGYDSRLVQEAADALAKAQVALEKCARADEFSTCIICRNHEKISGHKSNCPIGAALEAMR